MLNKSHIGPLLALSLLLAACQKGAQEAPPLAGASLGGPFALTSESGKIVKDSDFAGQYRLVYFGYTFCPDVCPVDVQKLMAGLSALEKSAPKTGAKIQPLFISVDPARDTPAALTQFTDAFHPRLIGMTAPEAELAPVIKAYGAYAKLGEKRPDGSYLVDHTRNALLFGPKGEPLAIIKHDGSAQEIAAELDRWVE